MLLGNPQAYHGDPLTQRAAKKITFASIKKKHIRALARNVWTYLQYWSQPALLSGLASR